MIKKLFTIKRFIYFGLIAFIISLYSSDFVMFTLPKMIQDKTSIGVENQFDKLRSPLMKSVDSVNFFNWISTPKDEFPEFNMQFTKKDINYISEVIGRAEDKNFISNFDNDYRNTKLIYKGESYEAKFRIHGSNYPNYVNPKKSYAIKMKNGNLIENMKRFSFIILDEMSIPALFAYKFSSYFGGLKVENQLVKLNINGVYQGVYFLEEKLHKSLLEKNGLSGVDIFKQMDEWNNQYGSGHQDPYSERISYTKNIILSDKEIGQALRYEYLMNHSNDFKIISRLIDINEFAKFDAMRILFGSYHPIQGDNLKYLYNTSTGKFSPYFRIENHLKDIFFNSYSDTIESHLYKSYSIDGKNDNKIFQTLVKNDDYRSLRNSYLENLIINRVDILEIYDKLLNKSYSGIKNDSTGFRSARYYLFDAKESRKKLVSNLNILDHYLSYSRVFTDVKYEKSGNILIDIAPDSNSPLKLIDLKFYSNDNLITGEVEIKNLQSGELETLQLNNLNQYFSNINFMLGLNDSLDVKKRSFKYELFFKRENNIDRFSVRYINKIKDKEITKNNFTSFLKVPPSFDFAYLNTDIEDFMLNNSKLGIKLIDKKTFSFNNDETIIIEDLIFPYGYDLLINAGSDLKIYPKKSIVVYGSLYVNGTQEKPVNVSSFNKQPFGVLAAIGAKNSNSQINYLNLSNGSESEINGSFLSGALSLYFHQNVSISNSTIYNNNSDDGLNIKFSNALIADSNFFGNFSDQVDLDSVNAIITNSDFISLDGSLNGDGLDFSDSNAIVKCSYFSDFSDKGISIGEESKILLSKNNFVNNNTAIAVKDSSNSYFNENTFTNNSKDIDNYIKKEIFNIPKLFFIDSKFMSQENLHDCNSLDYLNSQNTANLFEKLNNYAEEITINDN